MWSVTSSVSSSRVVASVVWTDRAGREKSDLQQETQCQSRLKLRLGLGLRLRLRLRRDIETVRLRI